MQRLYREEHVEEDIKLVGLFFRAPLLEVKHLGCPQLLGPLGMSWVMPMSVVTVSTAVTSEPRPCILVAAT